MVTPSSFTKHSAEFRGQGGSSVWNCLDLKLSSQEETAAKSTFGHRDARVNLQPPPHPKLL